MTGQMLMRGTQSRSREDIQDELARLQSTLGVSGGTGSAGASMQSTRDNLAAVIRLAAEILREPSFPESEWTQMRESALASIEAQRSEPQAIVQQEMQRYAGQHYGPDDIRYTPTFDEQIGLINELGVDDFHRFHDRFYGASDVEIAVVGDFDADEIASVIEEELGDWESPREYERITTPYLDPPHAAVDQSFETPDKENAFFMVRQPIRMSTDHEDYPALVLANYILGSGPGSRLFGRIRGEEGLSYGVGSNFGAPDDSDNAQFLSFAIAAPQNITAVEASFRDEIESILAEGYTSEEVELGKTSWAQQRQLGRTQDGSVAGMLAGHLELERTMEWDAELEARVLALSASEVREAMRRHLDPEAMSFMKGGDFAGAEE
jgi:zinc protease